MPWDTKLARTLALKDGRKIVTLKGAADVLTDRFTGVLKDAGLEHAIELLMKAEWSGKQADIKAATDQVALVLRHAALLAK